MAIFAGDHPSESVKVRHSHVASKKDLPDSETVQDRRQVSIND